MKFEEAVRHHMASWPSLSPNRVTVLDSLFLHFGDGGVWHEGVIRNIYETDDDPEKGQRALAELERERDETIARTRKLVAGSPDLLDKFLANDRKYWGAQIEELRRVIDHLDDMATGKHWCVVERGFYALNKSAHAVLQNVPDNVQPDWLAGAREVCALILACPLEGTQEGSAKRNKRFVRAILKDLDKRFGKPEVEPDVSYVTWGTPKPSLEDELDGVLDLKPETVETVKEMWAKVMADGKETVQGGTQDG